jgi:uncharacterized membrane protein
MKRIALGLLLVLTFFGIADMAYLAQSERDGVPLICDVKTLSQCNNVVSSPYSRLFGISLADFGLVFFIVMFVLVVTELRFPHPFLRRLIQLGALVGVFASCYSLYTQLVVLQAICIYCMASVATMFLMAPCATVLEPLSKKPPLIHLPT